MDVDEYPWWKKIPAQALSELQGLERVLTSYLLCMHSVAKHRQGYLWHVRIPFWQQRRSYSCLAKIQFQEIVFDVVPCISQTTYLILS